MAWSCGMSPTKTAPLPSRASLSRSTKRRSQLAQWHSLRTSLLSAIPRMAWKSSTPRTSWSSPFPEWKLTSWSFRQRKHFLSSTKSSPAARRTPTLRTSSSTRLRLALKSPALWWRDIPNGSLSSPKTKASLPSCTTGKFASTRTSLRRLRSSAARLADFLCHRVRTSMEFYVRRQSTIFFYFRSITHRALSTRNQGIAKHVPPFQVSQLGDESHRFQKLLASWQSRDDVEQEGNGLFDLNEHGCRQHRCLVLRKASASFPGGERRLLLGSVE